MPAKKQRIIATHFLTVLLAWATGAWATDLTDLYPDEAADRAMESLERTAADPAVGAIEEDGEAFEDGIGSPDEETSVISDLLADSNPYALPKDVVMVLDNSGSMKKNDPEFLATQAVSEFISGLDEQTRIAIIIFDQQVNLAVPLTVLTLSAREKVLDSLEKVNYKGLFTDSPAAVERAIYELKNNGRSDARKSIVFMTDGIVDTGEPDIDLEKSKWLKQDLAADAADESIKIFGVAFTDDADFQLIQSVAQKTDGEYYRALQAEDLHRVFQQINSIINRPPEPVIEPVVEPQKAEPEPAPAQQPVIIEVPAQAPTSMSREERLRSTIMMVAAAILIITLIAIFYVLLKRNRESGKETPEAASEAYINDPQNYTGTSQYRLGNRPTMFGRVGGKDTDHLNYIVIPESTIGRRHALIEYKDYGYWISDQGSINGTFVNDQMISGEVCLKHGDRVRLHKYEFEFSMPEMDDAGMTVVSNTQFAGGAAAPVAPVASEPENVPEPEFDITGGATPEPEFDLDTDDGDSDEEETLVRSDRGMSESDAAEAVVDDEDETLVRKPGGDAGEGAAELSSEDETLLPAGSDMAEDTPADGKAGDADEEDETLLRSGFDGVEDDEMTIRKDADEALEDFFDIEADEKPGDKK